MGVFHRLPEVWPQRGSEKRGRNANRGGRFLPPPCRHYGTGGTASLRTRESPHLSVTVIGIGPEASAGAL